MKKWFAIIRLLGSLPWTAIVLTAGCSSLDQTVTPGEVRKSGETEMADWRTKLKQPGFETPPRATGLDEQSKQIERNLGIR